MKKKNPISQNILTNFFSLLKPKVFLSSLPFLKFWKQNFMYFAHKRVETGPNYSHEISNVLKYHMPLNQTEKNVWLCDSIGWTLGHNPNCCLS